MAQIFWLIGLKRNEFKDAAIDLQGYLNEMPSDEVLLVKDLYFALMYSSYKQGGDAIPESYHTATQLPAFVGRYKEKESALSDNTWAVIAGRLPQSAPILPCLTKNIDWAIRLTESGPNASLIQKYIDRPLLMDGGNQKMIFRMSIFLKSVLPLQAFVSKKVQVLHALKSFTTAEGSFGDEEVHLCQSTAGQSYFGKMADKDALFEKSVDSVRKVLKAFQVQFAEEIKKEGEQKRRAIYSVDI